MRSRNILALRSLRVGLALACLALGGSTVAAQSQRKAPGTTPATPASRVKDDPLAPLLQQANEAIDKMDFAAALDPLQKYIAQRPEEAYAHFQLGYAYVGLKRAEDAKGEFSRAVALDPMMAEAHLNLGLVSMDSDPAAAAEAFRHAAELQPTESRPRFLAAVSLERAGKIPEAIEQYRAALALSPKYYEAQFSLARLLLRSKDALGAEEHFRAALESRPDAAPAKLGLASSLLAQRKFQAVSDVLAEYLKSNPGNDGAHFDRAEALLNLGRFDDALGELDRINVDGTLVAKTSKKRGEIYMHQKKWPEAEAALKQAVSLAPQDEDLAEWLGDVEIELHNYPAAIRILEQVQAQSPQSTDALNDLSIAFYKNEDYASALGAMDRLAKLETPKPGSWFIRAICYDKLARQAEAIESYQKFLDLDNGLHDSQDFQARHRILALQRELEQSTKKKKQ